MAPRYETSSGRYAYRNMEDWGIQQPGIAYQEMSDMSHLTLECPTRAMDDRFTQVSRTNTQLGPTFQSFGSHPLQDAAQIPFQEQHKYF